MMMSSATRRELRLTKRCCDESKDVELVSLFASLSEQ